MAASFALDMRRESAITSAIKTNAQATQLAESGIAIAEMMLLNPDPIKRWRTDGSIYQIDFAESPEKPGGSVRIRLLSESGKIDINKADVKMLTALMARSPIEDEKQQTKLVGALLDWRDQDDLIHIEGAEKKEYKEAGLRYGPRNKPFQSLEELQMVLGMDAATINWLTPLVTVYSGQAQINPQLATKEVLLALPEVDASLIQDYITARLESATKGLPAPPSPLGPGQQPQTSPQEALTVISEAVMDDGSSASISAIIKKSEENPNTPFKILKWQGNTVIEQSLFDDTIDTSTNSELLVKQYAEFEFNR
jgi:general secretion pathway protein K